MTLEVYQKTTFENYVQLSTGRLRPSRRCCGYEANAGGKSAPFFSPFFNLVSAFPGENHDLRVIEPTFF
jgi:hypothetical protein